MALATANASRPVSKGPQTTAGLGSLPSISHNGTHPDLLESQITTKNRSSRRSPQSQHLSEVEMVPKQDPSLQGITMAKAVTPPKAQLQKRPRLLTASSEIKRTVSSLFRRPTHPAHTAALTLSDGPSDSFYGSDAPSVGAHSLLSDTRTPSTSTPSRLHTPQSSGPSSELDETEYQTGPVRKLQYLEPMNKTSASTPKRTPTGFLMGKLQSHKQKDEVVHETYSRQRPKRASSFETTLSHDDAKEDTSACPDFHRNDWELSAAMGTGAKARRMSMSVPDDLAVDIRSLHKEYAESAYFLPLRGKALGKGATAHVRKMHKKGGPTSKSYAVKEFRAKSVAEKQDDYEKKIKSEFCIARSTHHPNIVESFHLCTHNGRWNHVMEYCENGDLYSLVNGNYLKEEKRAQDRHCLFKQLIQGLHYLHEHGIAHRDVKLENLLITHNSQLKITDFGVSEVFTGTHPGMRSAGGECGKDMGDIRLCGPGICGSPPYIAPEVMAKEGMFRRACGLPPIDQRCRRL